MAADPQDEIQELTRKNNQLEEELEVASTTLVELEEQIETMVSPNPNPSQPRSCTCAQWPRRQSHGLSPFP